MWRGDISHSLGTDRRSPVLYHVFDVLWLDGRSVSSLPLEERRALLKKLPLRAPLDRAHSLEDAKPSRNVLSSHGKSLVG